MTRCLAPLAFLILALLTSAPLHAACVNPAGPEGEAMYNADYHVMQFCNGTKWISMAASGMGTEVDPKIGTLTNGKWCSTNGNIITCTADAPVSGVGGSSGQLQYNSGTGLGGAAALTYATSGDLLTATALTATDTPLVVKGAASQSANLTEWLNSSGAALVTITSDGKVGIGTTSSDVALDVNGDVRSSAVITIQREGTAPHFDLFSYGVSSGIRSYFTGRAASGTKDSPGLLASGDRILGLYAFPYNGSDWSSLTGAIEFILTGTPSSTSLPTSITFATAPSGSTSRTERLRIDATGNVGIGSTAPAYKLDVAGTLNATGAASFGSTLGVTGAVTSSGTATANAFIPSGSTVPTNGLFLPATNSVALATNSSARLTIDSSGNIGIATTGPAAKLDILTTGDALALSNWPMLKWASNIIDFGGYNALQWQGIKLHTNGGERIRIDSTGNVGIGTSAPNVKLDVAGPIVSRVYNAGSSTSIDWANSNVAYTSASCGAFTFSNMQDGGTYTLFVKGTTSGTCSFTHSGLTVKLPPGHGATGTGTMTVYTFTRAGSDVFTTWVKGY